MIVLYVGGIVAANLTVSELGPSWSVLTAFLFIGLLITARDRLHDEWSGDGLKWKMGAVIVVGGALSYLVSPDTARLAIAGTAAFVVSESADAVVYHARRHLPWMRRVNESNVVSSGVDSVLFPTLAFGVFLPWVILGQFVAKVFGGAIWAAILRPAGAR